jgi:putative SOS response-associated peptidase YedK
MGYESVMWHPHNAFVSGRPVPDQSSWHTGPALGSVRPDRKTADFVCGRFTSSQRREAIGERFEVAVPETYTHRFNLAPQQRALIVRERDDEREAVMAKWGLLPHWAKDAKIAFKMINARAETLTEKPAYRSLIGKHRCLIPADGFYEWTSGSDGKKQPMHFHLPGYELFAFAGLWTSRTDDGTGEIIESCTIITTTPNELVAPVHDRMPVILPTGAEAVWLDPTIAKEHALSVLEPYPADLMLALPASTRVNSVRNDDCGLLRTEDALAA